MCDVREMVERLEYYTMLKKGFIFFFEKIPFY